MVRQIIIKLIEKSVKGLQRAGELPEFEIPLFRIEYPEEKSHGDYASNVAMQIAKEVKKRPTEIANLLSEKLKNEKLFGKTEAVNPGFINFFLSKEYLQKQVGKALKEGDKFGNLKIGKGQKINVEFISANPTGPLTLGNGRGGFCGDVLANVLEKTGYKVTREYYINDTGEQIKKLGHSVINGAEAVYKGDYIESLRKKIKEKDPIKAGEKAAKIILEEIIKPAVKKMGIKFDVWFSEKRLYEKKETNKILSELKKKNLTYEKDGALWLRTTQFGDDKDRVLIKSDASSTYCFQDIAYLKNKFKRDFKKLIFFWGADHYGYIDRIKAAVEALGYKKEQADFIVMQMVRLFEGGKEVRMSKRAGIYVTIDELIDEVGLDAARFFFLQKSPDTHFDFDMDLAKEQSKKNPVYYVQYAHARICSILKKIQMSKSKCQIPDYIEDPRRSRDKSKIPAYRTGRQNLKLLTHPAELSLIKQLIRLPEIVEDAAKDYQVQRLPQYAISLADAFHKFYENCKVIGENKELTRARLSLVLAAKIVLKNTLDLMGVSAPEKM